MTIKSFFSTIKKLTSTGLFLSCLYGWFIPLSLLPELYPTPHNIQIAHQSPQYIEIDNALLDDIFANDDFEDSEDAPTEIEAVKSSSHNISPIAPKKIIPQNSHVAQTAHQKAEDDSHLSTPSGITKHKVLKEIPEHPLKSRRSQTSKRKNKRCNIENPGIQSKNDTHFEMSKDLIQYYSMHWGEAAELAFLTWSRESSGEIKGINIRQIPCNSPLKFTGLKRGDVVLAVNGTPMTSESKMMMVYGKLMIVKRIEFSILRDGKPLTIQYKIV